MKICELCSLLLMIFSFKLVFTSVTISTLNYTLEYSENNGTNSSENSENITFWFTRESNIKSLIFKDNAMTLGIGNTSFPQLKCKDNVNSYGISLCKFLKAKTIECFNGKDQIPTTLASEFITQSEQNGNNENQTTEKTWYCNCGLISTLRCVELKIRCVEVVDNDKNLTDPDILLGSCRLEYTLEFKSNYLTPNDNSKINYDFDFDSTFPKDKPIYRSSPDTSSSRNRYKLPLIFISLVIKIIFVGLYLNYRNNKRKQREAQVVEVHNSHLG